MLSNHFEGLCVPALGIRRYQLMGRALMELLPHLIPGTLSLTTCGASWNSPSLGLTLWYQFRFRPRPMPMTSSALLNRTSCTSIFRANKTSIMTTAHAAASSFASSSSLALLIPLPPSNHTSTRSGNNTMTAIFPHTYASTVWLPASTRIHRRVCVTSSPHAYDASAP